MPLGYKLLSPGVCFFSLLLEAQSNPDWHWPKPLATPANFKRCCIETAFDQLPQAPTQLSCQPSSRWSPGESSTHRTASPSSAQPVPLILQCPPWMAFADAAHYQNACISLTTLITCLFTSHTCGGLLRVSHGAGTGPSGQGRSLGSPQTGWRTSPRWRNRERQ